MKHYIPAEIGPNATLKEIAAAYNVSISTASKWRRAIREGDHEKIQKEFSFPSRILGILWAIGYDAGDFFFIRHNSRKIVKEIKKHFNVHSKIITGKSMTDTQYRLKITGHTRLAIMDELQRRGWSARKAEVRDYPGGNIDHREFIGAWIQLHSYFYARRNQLRVYGNKSLIETMNEIIPRLLPVTKKTPQQLHNKITYGLYYQSEKEVAQMIEFFGLDYALSQKK